MESFDAGGGSNGAQKKVYFLEVASQLNRAMRCDGHTVRPIDNINQLGYASHKERSKLKEFKVLPSLDYFDLHFLDNHKLVDGNIFDGIVLRISLTESREETACPLWHI